MTIERTDAVFAVVCAATPETMSREQIGDHVVRLRRLRSWLDAQDVRVARRTAELEAAGQSEPVETLAARTGGRSGRDARDLTRRLEVCEQLPVVEAALSTGEITSGHVDAIAHACQRLDDEGRAELGEFAGDLVTEASRTGVDAFQRSMRDLAGSIIARRNAQAAVSELEAQRAASTIKRWVDRHTGMHHTHLELDPIRDAKLHSAINAELAKLRAVDGNAGTPWNQLQIDAVINAVTRSAPDASGTGRCVDRAPEISVLIGYDRLISDAATHGITGICETENSVPLPAATVRRMCCDAEIIPIILGSTGEVLDQGRAVRTATRPQRRALRAMHQGCAHPDCTVGFDACRIHHIRWWWEHNGPTDIDNLLPLCERHHHQVHEGGWTLTMTPDRVATWTRPDGTVHFVGSTIDRTLRQPAA